MDLDNTLPSSGTSLAALSGAAEPEEPDELARGTAIGRYLLLGKLGAGGMGVVYVAHDPELDREDTAGQDARRMIACARGFMRTCRYSSAWWVASLLWVTVPHRDARADVVGPAPDDCPAGSFGDSCHAGPFCRPSTCESDAACAGGATCQEVKVCVGGIQCGGLEGGEDPPVPTFAGLCKGDGTCEGEASCQPLKQCVGGPDPTSGGGSGGGTTGDTSGDTSKSTVGDPASSSTGGTGNDKHGCAGCSTDAGPGAGALALLAFTLLRRRRGARASR